MTHRSIPQAFPPLLALMLCLLSAVWAQAVNAPNRRILDVKLSKHEDSVSGREVYRIQIHLSDLGRYRIEPPRPGEPLIVTLSQAEAPFGLEASPSGNELIRRMRVIPSDTGLVQLAFDLNSTQVSISDFPIRSPITVIVLDLKLLPGVVLASELHARMPETDTPAERVSATATPPVASAPQAEETALPGPATHAEPVRGASVPVEPPLALPGGAAARPVSTTPSTAAVPPPSPGAIAVPLAPGSEMPSAEQREYDYFPIGEIRMDFPDSDKILELYKAHKNQEALTLAIRNLHYPQPRWSLESLVYLAAECRYQLAAQRHVLAAREPGDPDWPAALNYYIQARRFARQSPLRPIADYRISQIYYVLGRLPEQLAELDDLLDREKYLPFEGSALWFLANGALSMAREMHNTGGYLEKAEWALRRFRERFPGSTSAPRVEFFLGEIAYQRGDYREAYELMLKAHREALRSSQGRLAVPLDMYAHFALAAHREGKANLVRPQTEEDRTFRESINQSRDPSVRLEFARILDAGGARREAMAQYRYVLRDLSGVASPEEVFEAKLALTRYALTDTLAGGLDGTIPYDEYRSPYRTLKELYDNTYDLRLRADLLREEARHLIAQGRKAEAIRLILPHLEPGRLPEDVARELRQAIWDVMPEVMRDAQEQGDYLQALRIYEAFGEFLDEHPRRNDILLDCARILLDAGLRDQARRVTDRLLNRTPYADLTASQQSRLTKMSRELRLDPTKPEELKRDARAILESADVDQVTKARVLKLLAETWAAEGNHARAAELYLRGADFDQLGWRPRLEFFDLAAGEYQKQAIFRKVIEVAWQAIRFVEDQGAPYSDAPEQIQSFLLMLGSNFQKLDNHEQAAKAYQQYLDLFPAGANAASARYELATCYEKLQRIDQALGEYRKLEKEAGPDSFWGKLAAQSAGYIEWKNSRSYLRNTEAPTP